MRDRKKVRESKLFSNRLRHHDLSPDVVHALNLGRVDRFLFLHNNCWLPPSMSAILVTGRNDQMTKPDKEHSVLATSALPEQSIISRVTS